MFVFPYKHRYIFTLVSAYITTWTSLVIDLEEEESGGKEGVCICVVKIMALSNDRE